MSVKHVKGDLLKMVEQGQFDVIVHGCNCFHIMGSGIAFSIAQKWPEVAAADKNLSERGDRDKLGKYTKAIVPITPITQATFASIQGGVISPAVTVLNLYTQYETSPRGQDVFEYEAFIAGLKRIRLAYPRSRIGMPKIGCGLAGGDEKLIMAIIEHFMKDADCTVVEYQK